jgi:hypothetical protein
MELKNNLEEFIISQRSDFDVQIPSEKVWEKVNARVVNSQKNRRFSKVLYRVAAVVVLFFSIAILTYRYNKNSNEGTDLYGFAANSPEIIELRDAEIFYKSQINEKIILLEKCSQSHPDLVLEVEKDLTELDLQYNSLKGDLKENVSNQEVIDAMIENNRERLGLIENVLTQINC